MKIWDKEIEKGNSARTNMQTITIRGMKASVSYSISLICKK